jgi:hypothetical protein
MAAKREAVKSLNADGGKSKTEATENGKGTKSGTPGKPASIQKSQA